MRVKRVRSLITCDFCGGPAYWTIIAGELCYSCKQPCDGFAQLELFGGTFEELEGSSTYEGGEPDDYSSELPF